MPLQLLRHQGNDPLKETCAIAVYHPFKRPTKLHGGTSFRAARHNRDGGELSRMPHANKIWSMGSSCLESREQQMLMMSLRFIHTQPPLTGVSGVVSDLNQPIENRRKRETAL